MLQIISKKFFRSDDPDAYFETDRKAIIYSNLDTFNNIETSIANLERIESYKGITTYLMTYKNRIEKQNSTSQLVAVGDNEIVNDFLCCCTFWFNSVFSSEKFFVEKLTRTEKEGIADSEIPNKILPKFFSLRQNTNIAEISSFKNFMDDLIGLKRDKYIEVMKVLRQYQDAAYTINSNLELSYTMFVASIESLAQKFDGFESEWSDCPEKMVKKFDILFEELPEDKAESIKSILIEETHNKLARRFEAFCLKYINSDFFRGNAIGIQNPIRKSHLKNAIKSSYELRSRYVHTLNELPDMIKLGGSSEIFVNGKKAFLTFSGISRLCRYIIYEFVRECEKIENEPFNYFNDIPGMIQVSMAPQYWIYKEEALNFENLVHYTNNFLRYYTSIRIEKESIVDCSAVCKKIEEMFKQTNNNDHKLKLLLIYVLYNSYLVKEQQVEGWEKLLEENETTLDPISLESLILHVMTYSELPWDVNEVIGCYNDYDSKRFWNKGFKIPQIVEVCILLEISNMFFSKGDKKTATLYIEKAIEEKPGDQYLLDILDQLSVSDSLKVNWQDAYFDINRSDDANV